MCSITWDIDQTIHENLLQHIKQGILQGKLKEQLPSSRVLATALNVNRNTIIKALEELVWEGYLSNLPKVGYFITPSLGYQKQSTRTYKLPYRLPKQMHFPSSPETRKSVPPSIVSFLKKYALGRIQDIDENQTYEYFASKYKWDNNNNTLTWVRNNFESDYLLSRILLEENDGILVSNLCKNYMIQNLPNLDLKISNLPIHANQINLTQLQAIFQASSALKFIYIHHLHDGIIWTPQHMMSFMELCYRYGIIIIENIYLTNNITSRQHTLKKYDYKHYVITVLHEQQFFDHSLTCIVSHEQINASILRFKKNMQIEIPPLWLQFHLHEIILKLK